MAPRSQREEEEEEEGRGGGHGKTNHGEQSRDGEDLLGEVQEQELEEGWDRSPPTRGRWR